MAANGLEALDALARIEYDAVLMDCQMPEMDGYTATAEFRSRHPGRSIPIIAMTAGATEADRDRCLAAGMDDYLAKPVRPEQVAAMLARWLDQPPAAPVDPTPVAPAADPPVLDERRLDDIRAIGPPDGSFLAELVDIFLGDGRKHVALLDQAVADGDSLEARREAHHLSGQASTLGAARLASVAARLETQAEAGQLDHAAAAVARIATEFDLVEIALTATVEAARAPTVP